MSGFISLVLFFIHLCSDPSRHCFVVSLLVMCTVKAGIILSVICSFTQQLKAKPIVGDIKWIL